MRMRSVVAPASVRTYAPESGDGAAHFEWTAP